MIQPTKSEMVRTNAPMITRRFFSAIKTLTVAWIFLSFSTTAKAQTSLTITVKNIASEKGSIRVGLFRDADSFLKKAAEGKVVKARRGEVTVVFEALPAGEYGISVIHDENNNGELDTNGLGIPKEGLAFGNNARGTFGPPSFAKSKVTIEDEPQQQSISLKYY